MSKDVNFYKLLGVSKQATKDEIKKAYRKVALKFHPDQAGQEYESVFRKIKEAYDTLIDDYRRKMYDKFGFSGQSNLELQNESYNLIRDLILDLINKQGEMIFYLNIIDVVNAHCIKTIDSLEKEIDKLVKKKNYLERVENRFSCRRSLNGGNLMMQVFLEEKAVVDTQIWDRLSKIQTLDRVGSTIQNYDFKFDDKIELGMDIENKQA